MLCLGIHFGKEREFRDEESEMVAEREIYGEGDNIDGWPTGRIGRIWKRGTMCAALGVFYLLRFIYQSLQLSKLYIQYM